MSEAGGNETAEAEPDGVPAATDPGASGGGGGPIRRRVIRTLTLPVAAVLLLLGVITVIQVDDYRTAAQSARAVSLVLAVQDLVQELQTERGLTSGLLGGNVGFKAELGPARQRVDEQRAAVEHLIASGGDVQERVASAVRGLDGLAGVRAGIDAGGAGRAPNFDFYTGRIAALSDLDYRLDSSADPALRRGVTALEALGDVKESTAQERAFLNGVFSAGGFRGDEYVQFVTMKATKDAALTAFAQYATATQRTAKDYVLDTGAGRVAAYFEQLALNAGDGRNLQVNPQAWWSALTTVLDDMLRLQQHVGSVIQARAQTLQDQATSRMGVLVGAVLLCFAGAVYLATVASRSIALPLATLATEANRLAGERLPDAVRKVTAGADDDPPPRVRLPAGASDEVRLMADALDRVQATAYDLATEQAMLRHSTTESLANLGRRSQNLLRRQLGFITSLEREESDPTGLANLFELDHLATRMRRNAESLLVLVGAASPRQWSQPLPIADVIRAAVSEVEEYRRVTLRRVDNAFVVGAVVSGVAHMLAELVENGLTFSPPDADVEIHGRLLNDSYLIAITDQGIGMNRDDLELANQRLRGEGDFITAPNRFLGHYVVGRLATEMDIDVQLVPSPVTGVTARIVLPAAVLAMVSSVAGHTTTTAPIRQPAVPLPDNRRALNPAADVESTQVLTLEPSPEPSPVTADRQILAQSIEYVTVPAAPAPSRYEAVSTTEAAPASRFETVAVPYGRGEAHRPPEGDDSARTVNGLRKRNPKARKPSETAQPARPRGPDRPAPVGDSPNDVRNRLTAFRNGMQRSAKERTDRP